MIERLAYNTTANEKVIEKINELIDQREMDKTNRDQQIDNIHQDLITLFDKIEKINKKLGIK